MTGIPQFNFPAFEAAAKELRDVGLTIISPVETDSPTVREAALASEDGRLDKAGKIAGESWGQILGRDVELIADKCNGIILLSGWEKSKGARLEVVTGLLCYHTIFMYEGGKLEEFGRRLLLARVMDATL
jgi:hypothetical protein